MSNGHESAQSRRSLRQARATSGADHHMPFPEGSKASPASGHQPHARPTKPAVVSLEPAPARERRSRRAADAPLDAPSSASSTERVSQVRARDREMLRNYRALADQQAELASGVPTRRQLRLQQQAAREKALQDEGAPSNGQDGQDGQAETADRGEMTVEQALAAREAIINQAKNQVAVMEAAAKEDPFSVDLEILAQQKALAERAAVLNTRAQKIQQLTQENRQRKPLLNDPTTAHNLSIVSPAEFVRALEESPEAAAPSISHIPVVTRTPPALSSPSPGPTAPAAAPLRAASDGVVTPIRARSAHGLDPLDAMTAGLARVQRMRIAQYSVVGLGALALIIGIMMIVSGV